MKISRHASRSTRLGTPSRGAAIALIWLVAVPAHASEAREVAKVEGWSVVYDPAGEGACYARGTQGGGTSLAVGKIAPGATWVAVVSNPALSPVQVGATYEVRFVFDRKYIWSQEAVAAEDGLRSSDVGEEFVDDFARASSLKLFLEGRGVDAFELVGTRAAVAAINHCYVFYTRKAGPYALPEPVEAQTTP